jgi:hypothetical protein
MGDDEMSVSPLEILAVAVDALPRAVALVRMEVR